MDQTAQSHEPITMSGKRNNPFVLATDSWQATQETLYLLSVPGMRESIKEGLAGSVDTCARELNW